MSKYWCELRTGNGSPIFVEVDARDWPVLPDAIVYRGRIFVHQSDHRFREARIFWFSVIPTDRDQPIV